MSAVVLDSYALLAFFRKERGESAVRKLLDAAADQRQELHMTEVNYMEVKYMLIRKQGEAAWRRESLFIAALPIQFHPLDRVLADLAADYKANHALSLADACAAALAKVLDCPVVTGDPEFKPLAKEIKIHWI